MKTARLSPWLTSYVCKIAAEESYSKHIDDVRGSNSTRGLLSMKCFPKRWYVQDKIMLGKQTMLLFWSALWKAFWLAIFGAQWLCTGLGVVGHLQGLDYDYTTRVGLYAVLRASCLVPLSSTDQRQTEVRRLQRRYRRFRSRICISIADIERHSLRLCEIDLSCEFFVRETVIHTV